MPGCDLVSSRRLLPAYSTFEDLIERGPCYFWFFQPQADDDWEPREICPVCGGALVPYNEGIFHQLLCETDRVVLVGR